MFSGPTDRQTDSRSRRFDKQEKPIEQPNICDLMLQARLSRHGEAATVLCNATRVYRHMVLERGGGKKATSAHPTDGFLCRAFDQLVTAVRFLRLRLVGTAARLCRACDTSFRTARLAGHVRTSRRVPSCLPFSFLSLASHLKLAYFGSTGLFSVCACVVLGSLCPLTHETKASRVSDAGSSFDNVNRIH